jgi:hypothetical protein
MAAIFAKLSYPKLCPEKKGTLYMCLYPIGEM